MSRARPPGPPADESDKDKAAREREEQRRMALEQLALTEELIQQGLDSHGGSRVADGRSTRWSKKK